MSMPFAHLSFRMFISCIVWIRPARIYLVIEQNEIMVFKCSKCGCVFEEKQRLEIHKRVHGRKSKIDEYGSPEFNQDRLRG